MNLTGEILLNRFRVEEYLGSGGSGSVYRVWDLQRNAYLAIKVLHPHLIEDPENLEILFREARALENLAHPNIVPYYGLFTAPQATFLLEGYIEGHSLRDALLKQTGVPLPNDEVVHYFKAICSALQYAHAQGIIHCDVKPDNILRDNRGQVYLTDFGVALQRGSISSEQSLRGSPAYMAPEQIRNGPLVPQTDIYALGVILFETLSGGRRPFNGASALIEGSELQKVFWEHENVAPPSPRIYNPAISPHLEKIVLRCLDKDPYCRYTSPMEMFSDLAKAIADLEKRYVVDQQDTQTGRDSIFPVRRVLEKSHLRIRPDIIRILVASIILLPAIFLLTYMLRVLPPSPPSYPPVRVINTPVLIKSTTTPSPPKLPTLPTITKVFHVTSCMTVELDDNNKVEECVTNITIQADGKMRFDFTWTASLQPGAEIILDSSYQNRMMYLTDDLNNRYDFLDVGGDARRTLTLRNKSVAIGWFLFEAPAPGAKYFIFHDDDNFLMTSEIIRDW